MRLWSIHPKYLDAQGLVALWREALLARAVLRGETRGYRSHPQLTRFRSCVSPRSAIDAYLAGVYQEAIGRGYRFDPGKLAPAGEQNTIAVTAGQVSLEWQHLLCKLAARSPLLYEKWRDQTPVCHALFQVQLGAVESWERAIPVAGARHRATGA